MRVNIADNIAGTPDIVITNKDIAIIKAMWFSVIATTSLPYARLSA